MPAENAIVMEDLGKRYRIGQTVDLKRTFKETVMTVPRHVVGKMLGRRAGGAGEVPGVALPPVVAPPQTKDASVSSPIAEIAAAAADSETPHGTFWALRHMSLEIKQGDVVGLIGSNGAGKSTLLKVLSRITNPTAGRATLRGRISSLLEVGTGFHMELTGRENIFLNSAILGMRRSEVERKFDEIVAFSGVEKFLDTPVKRYSSGMYVRLAFAVAAHLESEIMLVDEILSVGDSEFQRKCLGTMKEMANTGRTVIYVSHNMSSVRTLCRTAMHLHRGQLVRYGNVDEVIEKYLQSTDVQSNEVTWAAGSEPGNEKARVNAVRVLKEDGTPCRVTELEKPVTIEVEYTVREAGTILNLSLLVLNQEDTLIFTSPSFTDSAWYMKPHPAGRYRTRCVIPGNLLNKGYYLASVYLVEKGNYPVAHMHRVVGFELIDSDLAGSYFGGANGMIRPQLDWRTEKTA